MTTPLSPNLDEAPIASLATQQLAAYNAHDVDAFVACYHPEVQVLNHRGEDQVVGIAAFREQYTRLFASFDRIEAHVSHRLVLGDHIVERECWSRQTKQGEAQRGDVLVRYTLRDGLIGYVEFLR